MPQKTDKEYPDDLDPEIIFPKYGISLSVPGYCYRNTRLNDHDIVFFTDGKGQVIVNGKQYDVFRGICIFFQPEDVYDFISSVEAPTKVFFIHFNPVRGKGVNRGYFGNMRRVFKVGERTAYFEEGFKNIIRDLKLETPAAETCAKGFLFHFLSYLISLSFMPEEEYVNPQIQESVNAARDFIEKNYMDYISLDDVASHVNLSPVYLGRIFKRLTGTSPGNYIMKTRIENAKRLLAQTEMPIKQIALEAGFAGVHYFTSLFSRKEKISPARYRKEYRRKKPVF